MCTGNILVVIHIKRYSILRGCLYSRLPQWGHLWNEVALQGFIELLNYPKNYEKSISMLSYMPKNHKFLIDTCINGPGQPFKVCLFMIQNKPKMDLIFWRKKFVHWNSFEVQKCFDGLIFSVKIFWTKFLVIFSNFNPNFWPNH